MIVNPMTSYLVCGLVLATAGTGMSLAAESDAEQRMEVATYTSGYPYPSGQGATNSRSPAVQPAHTLQPVGFFEDTGPMVHSRYGHSAVLLGNGKILIIGGSGHEAGLYRPEAELYDPESDMFSPAAQVLDPRVYIQQHTTHLADDRILIAGGCVPITPSACMGSDKAELYDPGTESFVATGDMHWVRNSFASALLHDGSVLIIGGSTSDPDDLYRILQAERYDPETGHWHKTAALPIGRFHLTATTLNNGQVLIVGGSSGDVHPEQALLFDPVSEQITSTGSLHTPRREHSATLLPDGRVLIVGGNYDEPNPHTVVTAEIYDPDTGTFAETKVPPNSPRVYHAATLLASGQVLLAGGIRQDLVSGAWEYPAEAEIFDPDSGMFLPAGEMARPGRFITATALPDGRAVLVGGLDPLINGITHGQIFTPFPPTISVTPTFIDFGEVWLGSVSELEVLTIENTGQVPLKVSEISPPTSEDSGLALAGGSCDAPPFDLEPGTHCTVDYTFTPQGKGPVMAGVTVFSTAESGASQVLLHGIGVPAPAEDSIFEDRFETTSASTGPATH